MNELLLFKIGELALYICVPSYFKSKERKKERKEMTKGRREMRKKNPCPIYRWYRVEIAGIFSPVS